MARPSAQDAPYIYVRFIPRRQVPVYQKAWRLVSYLSLSVIPEAKRRPAPATEVCMPVRGD